MMSQIMLKNKTCIVINAQTFLNWKNRYGI